ncbi:hypothetical protein AK830_g7416 [Neonectria ditissima]|uniref:Uncharacterized protein n=1 Tax=Neonectria ditissima TaxID=78410 RepID=A0A0P7BFF2_9HYPO|nr:hypothetical protein AK830_g7416 [Neonectria ditissima]
MPPDPTPPLPLAANRAALSNRISLLLASQSSVLKTMALTRPPPPTRRAPIPDDDTDLRAARPNEGVGYVPDAKDAARVANAREERMLRGGRVAKGNGKSRRKDDSESEDEVGRSALGKRKRPRREVDKSDAGATISRIGESADVDIDDDMKEGDTKAEENLVQPATIAQEHTVHGVQESDEGGKKKRKRKNKNKKKKPKTIEAQT